MIERLRDVFERRSREMSRLVKFIFAGISVPQICPDDRIEEHIHAGPVRCDVSEHPLQPVLLIGDIERILICVCRAESPCFTVLGKDRHLFVILCIVKFVFVYHNFFGEVGVDFKIAPDSLPEQFSVDSVGHLHAHLNTCSIARVQCIEHDFIQHSYILKVCPFYIFHRSSPPSVPSVLP